MKSPSPPGNDRLDRALRAIASENAVLGSSAAVEARLLEAVRASAVPRPSRPVLFAAIAASLAAALVVPVVQIAGRNGQTDSAAQTGGATEFYALPFSEIPVSGARLVRMNLTLDSAEALGVRFVTSGIRSRSQSTVEAEVLVGDDGLARAIRFLPGEHTP